MFMLVADVVKKTVQGVFNIFVYPVRILYFHGPGLMGYGFLEGRNKDTICYEMTGVKSEFWSTSFQAMEECEILIEKKFNAFVIGLSTILTLYIILSNLYLISIRYYISRPLTAEIEKKIESSILNIKKNQHIQ